MVDTSTLIKVGQLKKPYGIKGWLWVFSDLDNRSDIFDFSPWWIKTATGYQQLTVETWRVQGSGLVAKFEQVPDRTMAETMHGVTIWVQKAQLSDTAEDEFLYSDLQGLTVLNQDDVCFGQVKELFDTGAHPIMVIEPTADSVDNQERLIPWHKQTVVDVFLDKQVMVVDWETDF